MGKGHFVLAGLLALANTGCYENVCVVRESRFCVPTSRAYHPASSFVVLHSVKGPARYRSNKPYMPHRHLVHKPYVPYHHVHHSQHIINRSHRR